MTPMLMVFRLVRYPGGNFLFAFACLDRVAVGVQEQAGALGATGEHLAQVLVGELLADQVEGQSHGADAAGAVEQGFGLNVGGEVRAAGEHRGEVAGPGSGNH